MLISSRGDKPYSNLGRQFDGVAGIYALIDPRSGRVMYIGQSLDIGYRYRAHVDPDTYHDNLPKSTWLKGLRKEGFVPGIRVLERVADRTDLDERERATIRQYRRLGQAELNITAGGRSCRGRIAGPDATSLEDWRELGHQLKLIDALLIEAESLAESSFGRTHKLTAKIHSLIARLEPVRGEVNAKIHE